MGQYNASRSSRQNVWEVIIPGIAAALISTGVIRAVFPLTELLPRNSGLRWSLRFGSQLTAGTVLTVWVGRKGERIAQPAMRIAVLALCAAVILSFGMLLERYLPPSRLAMRFLPTIAVWTTGLSCLVCWMHQVPIHIKRLTLSVLACMIASQFVIALTYWIETSLGLHYTALNNAWSLVAAPQMRYMLQTTSASEDESS